MRCQDDAVNQVRPYAGVDATDRVADRRARLLNAGLDLLGGDHEPPDLTVRGICNGAGVATRYFYESFSDKDDFVAAVFDSVVARLAATTQAAVPTAPPGEQTRAGMANIVGIIATDARVGRLIFSSRLSNATVLRKRVESTALFALLSGQHAEAALQIPATDRIRAGAHFVVGGVAQTVSAWLSGRVELSPDELVDQLTVMIDRLANPKVYRTVTATRAPGDGGRRRSLSTGPTSTPL